ncbi:unnamed protein product [Rotaria magnacalcarata]
MRSNNLTAIDETECLSPSQSPENSFLQPSPTKLTITKTYSNKEKFMLIFNGYNLQFLNFNRKKTINVGDVQTEVVIHQYHIHSFFSNIQDTNIEIDVTIIIISMMMFQSYIIIFSIIFGLALTKPIEEKFKNESKSEVVPIEQVFRQAEMILHRYFYLIKSDTDQLVHAMLHMIINNPKSFPFVPPPALNIALANFKNKLGQDDINILIKPILLSLEKNAQNKSKQTSPLRIPDEVNSEIVDALDEYTEKHENNSHL